ncbi:FIGfam010717 [hydrothermal vent metagenome]|uniref:FIGfam010717 n=1 Tax=hydrothermal vent metagenome TaxID=652676 RepID=A0A3B0W947_9ZZZZ
MPLSLCLYKLTSMKKWLGLEILIFCFTLALGFNWATATATPQVVSQQEIQDAVQKYGLFAGRRLEAWQQLVNDNIGLSEATQLKNVNDFFNEVRFIDDIIHWKQKDYWATPVEMLSTDAGDCEDYTIAKYFTLKALGVSEKKLYLTYVKAIRLNQAHMVLTYFKTPQSIPLVLDNINKRILKATKRNDLVPVYSFNGDGLWLAKQRGKGRSVSGGTKKLKAWNNLLERLKIQ